MNIAVHNMTVGIADAGLPARARFIARAIGEGIPEPTFRLLRS